MIDHPDILALDDETDFIEAELADLAMQAERIEADKINLTGPKLDRLEREALTVRCETYRLQVRLLRRANGMLMDALRESAE